MFVTTCNHSGQAVIGRGLPVIAFALDNLKLSIFIFVDFYCNSASNLQLFPRLLYFTFTVRLVYLSVYYIFNNKL